MLLCIKRNQCLRATNSDKLSDRFLGALPKAGATEEGTLKAVGCMLHYRM
jgi:hypothetical protein